MCHTPRAIELLSPAKDLACGIEAVNHGADAVYIGAPKFGARSAAANSLDDIRQLCRYAHIYNVRVYAALNTILKESELKEAEELIRQLYEVGVDALIIQDMGITRLDIPPIPLHASTQTDNRTPEKVKFLESAGFSRVVLARELTVDEIREIAGQTTVPLEVFIHGALCVSYSGQCYLSAALSGRSANRGECAQYCRLPYTMVDADGREIVPDKHLLSLKDLNRSGYLEALLDAGASSLKIEGRLKDVSYVKNITAWYRKKLDAIFLCRPEYRRSSDGKSVFTFCPVPEKSFNRGFTSYFLNGREPDIASFDTPKSLGEPVGKVDEVDGRSLTVSGDKALANGDGLVFFNTRGVLDGFRINRVGEQRRVFPLETPPLLRPGMMLYRNYDQAFEKLLSKPSAERKIAVRMELMDDPSGFILRATDETGIHAVIAEPFDREIARSRQEENIRLQLSKLGNTPFEASEIVVSMSENRFAPSSLLVEMRRKAVGRLLENREACYRGEQAKRTKPVQSMPYPERELTYSGNVSNSRAEMFYASYGVTRIMPAFELSPQKDVPLMFTKHCLRYALGWCPTRQNVPSPFKEPFYLLHKGIRLRLQFDCKSCQMLLFSVD
ncbi:MAG: U32 family peptidase [Tannerellaceae bacterium]|jgi:putative protease|nr:U32 family peptidase [Tannerellaceae bacterium]